MRMKKFTNLDKNHSNEVSMQADDGVEEELLSMSDSIVFSDSIDQVLEETTNHVLHVHHHHLKKHREIVSNMR